MTKLKREFFEASLCTLKMVVVLSQNPDVVTSDLSRANATEDKMIYVHTTIEDISHLALAISIYYDTMYSLVITNYITFLYDPSLWIHSALNSLLNYRKAAIVYSPSVILHEDLNITTMENLPITAVFTRTKTIRRLLTSTSFVSDGTDGLSKVAGFLLCQSQRIMFVLRDLEDIEFALAKTDDWVCNNEQFAIRSTCAIRAQNKEVAAIVSLFRRDYAKDLLAGLTMNQFQLSRIVVYQCLHYHDFRSVLQECPKCRLFWSLNYDFKRVFRLVFPFALPQQFYLFYNDDIIPQPSLSDAVMTCTAESGSICGYHGRNLQAISSLQEEFTEVAVDRTSDVDYVLDMAGAATHHIRNVFKVRPWSVDYAEDMLLSLSNSVLCGVRTIVVNVTHLSLVTHFDDEYASYGLPESHSIRYHVYRYFLENRWIPQAGLSILEASHTFNLTKDDMYYFNSHYASLQQTRHTLLAERVDWAMDIAAEPIFLRMIWCHKPHSTAFFVTAFGMMLNMDITVLASTRHSPVQCPPFAARI